MSAAPDDSFSNQTKESGETVTEPGVKRFRFKSKEKHVKRDDLNDRHRHSHHRHHHRSKRRKVSSTIDDDPSAYDDSAGRLPPDVAFRESLFDALGDDEGAAYWEGVYGQPIHNYPDTIRNEETGELDKISDEEYAQYVRRKMWEKSWEGIEAAKEEQRKERERKKKKLDDESPNGQSTMPQHEPTFVFDVEFEKSLRRGEQRRNKKRWKSLWSDYLEHWHQMQILYESYKSKAPNSEQLFLRNKIAWPVESGKRKNVNAAEIERFVRNCVDSMDTNNDLLALLKSERIKWHPDKIQQRYGFMDIDDGTMQGVTAVFQVYDRMWNELRHKDQ